MHSRVHSLCLCSTFGSCLLCVPFAFVLSFFEQADFPSALRSPRTHSAFAFVRVHFAFGSHFLCVRSAFALCSLCLMPCVRLAFFVRCLCVHAAFAPCSLCLRFAFAPSSFRGRYIHYIRVALALVSPCVCFVLAFHWLRVLFAVASRRRCARIALRLPQVRVSFASCSLSVCFALTMHLNQCYLHRDRDNCRDLVQSRYVRAFRFWLHRLKSQLTIKKETTHLLFASLRTTSHPYLHGYM
jgi:hypothetical protein